MSAHSGYADLSRLCVLVVDDNPHMRLLMRRVLHALGIAQVRQAADGTEALQMLRQQPIDIAITDWLMQPAGGLDFLKAVRDVDTSANPYLPVIVMTGDATRATVTAARNAGVNELLAKPISPLALSQRLWSVIAKPRPFIRSRDYFGPDHRTHCAPPQAGLRHDDDEVVDLEAL